MSKAILVLDEMPSSCIECPCRTINLEGKDICSCLYEYNELSLKDLMHKRPSICPLKEQLDKRESYPGIDEYWSGHIDGWNNCIDEILL